MSDHGLNIRDLVVRYGTKTAVDRVSAHLSPGHIVALLGPSGSGKSSLLRAVAGLETVADGDITWDGASVVNVPVHQRGFGLMFQDGQLFPHRSVSGNVAFGLRGLSRAEKTQRVDGALELVGMSEYAARSVLSLSGGQAQRVALARSLAPRPSLLLLDEPLSALDRSLREHLSTEIRQILRQSASTCIYVTHDQDEAFAVADTIGVMIDGELAAWSSPQELWASPGTRPVAEFLGFAPFFPLEDGSFLAVPPGVLRVTQLLATSEAQAASSALPRTLSRGEQVTMVGEVVEARGARGRILVEVVVDGTSMRASADPSLAGLDELAGAGVQISLDTTLCPIVR